MRFWSSLEHNKARYKTQYKLNKNQKNFDFGIHRNIDEKFISALGRITIGLIFHLNWRIYKIFLHTWSIREKDTHYFYVLDVY